MKLGGLFITISTFCLQFVEILCILAPARKNRKDGKSGINIKPNQMPILLIFMLSITVGLDDLEVFFNLDDCVNLNSSWSLKKG